MKLFKFALAHLMCASILAPETGFTVTAQDPLLNAKQSNIQITSLTPWPAKGAWPKGLSLSEIQSLLRLKLEEILFDQLLKDTLETDALTQKVRVDLREVLFTKSLREIEKDQQLKQNLGKDMIEDAGAKKPLRDLIKHPDLLKEMLEDEILSKLIDESGQVMNDDKAAVVIGELLLNELINSKRSFKKIIGSRAGKPVAAVDADSNNEGSLVNASSSNSCAESEQNMSDDISQLLKDTAGKIYLDIDGTLTREEGGFYSWDAHALNKALTGKEVNDVLADVLIDELENSYKDDKAKLGDSLYSNIFKRGERKIKDDWNRFLHTCLVFETEQTITEKGWMEFLEAIKPNASYISSSDVLFLEQREESMAVAGLPVYSSELGTADEEAHTIYAPKTKSDTENSVSEAENSGKFFESAKRRESIGRKHKNIIHTTDIGKNDSKADVFRQVFDRKVIIAIDNDMSRLQEIVDKKVLHGNREAEHIILVHYEQPALETDEDVLNTKKLLQKHKADGLTEEERGLFVNGYKDYYASKAAAILDYAAKKLAQEPKVLQQTVINNQQTIVNQQVTKVDSVNIILQGGLDPVTLATLQLQYQNPKISVLTAPNGLLALTAGSVGENGLPRSRSGSEGSGYDNSVGSSEQPMTLEVLKERAPESIKLETVKVETF